MASKELKIRYIGDDSSVLAANRRMSAATSSLSSRLKRAGADMKRIGGMMSRAITLPVLAIGAASVKFAVDFEDAFGRIDALSNTSRANIAKWREQVLALAGPTATAPKVLADALFFLASAGLKADQVMPALEASAKASAAGLGDITDIAKITANALNAYAGTGLTATHVTDILVSAIKAGTAEPKEFAAALGRILPIASKAGVSFDQVAASIAALSNIGLSAEEGVTAMRGVLLALEAPGSQAAQTLKDVGLSADQMRAAIKDKGLLGALQLLEKATGGNIDTMRKIIPNVRALVAQFGLTGKNASTVEKIYNQVARAAGSTDASFDKMVKTLRFKAHAAFMSLQAAGIRIGNILLPILKKVADWISKMAEKFSHLSPKTQKFIMIVAGAAAVLGPVIVVIGGLITALAVLTSTVGLVVVAIGLLIYTGILVIANWEKVKTAALQIWGAINSGIGNFLSAMTDGIATFLDRFLDFVGGMIHGAAAAFGWIPGIGGKLKKAREDFDRWHDQIVGKLRDQADKWDTWSGRVQNAISQAFGLPYGQPGSDLLGPPNPNYPGSYGQPGSALLGPANPNKKGAAEGIHGFSQGWLKVGEEGPEVLKIGNTPASVFPMDQVGGSSLSGLAIEGTLRTPWGPAELRGVVREEIQANENFKSRTGRMRRAS